MKNLKVGMRAKASFDNSFWGKGTIEGTLVEVRENMSAIVLDGEECRNWFKTSIIEVA